ncbi:MULTISPECIES: HD domain-containing protein [unclassified Mycobacterium]|uniref:HD domain-containing protein n=1 Tax=unclassified Mycobacterium TaxID=2642494 RepID=UPI000801D202|nr:MULTISPECIES: HD domain-containing protein [unclassified Mycobacterium]OBG70686.1 phosphohydrolase [Mycobacterium sp. E1214]OBH23293.1 phosphohydrolase [Mycobacterium sp. E1319]
MTSEDRTSTTKAGDLSSWNLPDSKICTAAFDLAERVSPVFLHNHCVRSYLFGRELAAAQGMRGGADYDEETVFLASVLHDLGLTSHGRGDQRFEVEGADAAARFLEEQGLREDRVTTVWQSIALHTSIGLGHRFGAEHAVCHSGIDLDVVGARKELLPRGFADRVHAAWPRHNLGYAISQAIGRDTQRNPGKAPPFSFPAHIHEVVNNAPSVRFADLLASHGWGDEMPREFSAAQAPGG